jgi:hypothetical protein
MSKKLYKNSECDFCNDFMGDLKIKKHPLNDKEYIFCRNCYKQFYLEKKLNEKNSKISPAK